MTEREMNALVELLDAAEEAVPSLRATGRLARAKRLQEAVVEMKAAQKEADGDEEE